MLSFKYQAKKEQEGKVSNLAKTRDRVYEAIVNHTLEKGYAPTVREICELTKLKSTSTVHAHVQNLIKEGRLNSKDASPRTLISPDLEIREVASTMHQNKKPEQPEILTLENGIPTVIKWGNNIYYTRSEVK